MAFASAALLVAGLATVMGYDHDPDTTATTVTTATTAPTTTSRATTGAASPADDAAVALDPSCLTAPAAASGARLPPGDPYGTSLAEYGPRARVSRLYGVTAGRLYPLDGLAGVGLRAGPTRAHGGRVTGSGPARSAGSRQ